MNINKVQKYIERRKKRQRWISAVTVLGIIASMFTNALMANPADAMTGALICSQEEHTHTNECYITMPVHVGCAENAQEQHLHDGTCYDAEGKLVCNKEEYVIIHTHDNNCYDKDGNLICGMSEVQEHIHDASCYDAEGHVICGKREIKEHREHSEECYTTNEAGERVLTCTYPIAIRHQHAMACYDQTETVLICGKEEHVHTDSCYEQIEEEPVQEEATEEVPEETIAEEEIQPETAAEETAVEQTPTEETITEDIPEEVTEKVPADSAAETAEEPAEAIPTETVKEPTAEVQPETIEETITEENTEVPAEVQEETKQPEAETEENTESAPTVIEEDGKKIVFTEEETDKPTETAEENIEETPAEIQEEAQPAAEETKEETAVENIPAEEKEEPENATEESKEPAQTVVEEDGRTIVFTEETAEETVTEKGEDETSEETQKTEEPAEEKKEEVTEDKKSEEEQAEDKKKEETVAMPAVSFENSDTDVIVTVTAEEGSFPAGTEMRVVPVAAEEVTDAVQSTTEKSVVEIQAVDISFWYQEEEIEPLKQINVVMKPKAVTAEADNTAVVHVKDAGETEVVVEETAGVQEEVVFDTPSFSVYAIVYTVDFHYEVNGNTYDYSIPGGGAVSLSNLIMKLGVLDKGTDINTFISDIQDISFTEAQYIWTGKISSDISVGDLKAEKELQIIYSSGLNEEQIAEIDAQIIHTGDWVLISLRPFTSEEVLTVTMNNGDTFELRVTDAQISTNVLTADGSTYRITVSYDEEAGIPDGTELTAREIEFASDEYNQLIGRIWTEANKEYFEVEEMRENYDESMGILPDVKSVKIRFCRSVTTRDLRT